MAMKKDMPAKAKSMKAMPKGKMPKMNSIAEAMAMSKKAKAMKPKGKKKY